MTQVLSIALVLLMLLKPREHSRHARFFIVQENIHKTAQNIGKIKRIRVYHPDLCRFGPDFPNNSKSGRLRMFPRLEQHQQHQSTQQHLGHFSCITNTSRHILTVIQLKWPKCKLLLWCCWCCSSPGNILSLPDFELFGKSGPKWHKSGWHTRILFILLIFWAVLRTFSWTMKNLACWECSLGLSSISNTKALNSAWVISAV